MFSVPCQWKAEELLGGKPDRELKLQASYQSQRSSFHLVYFETPEGFGRELHPWGQHELLFIHMGRELGSSAFPSLPGLLAQPLAALALLSASLGEDLWEVLWKELGPAAFSAVSSRLPWLHNCCSWHSVGSWSRERLLGTKHSCKKRGLKERMGSFPLLCD